MMGDIVIIGPNRATKVALKNCVPCIKCSTAIYRIAMDDAKTVILLCRCIIC